MRKIKNTRPSPRFDRASWLRAAMDVLAAEGQAKLRVDAIAASLGVTKGSFYHHFRNREHFVECIVAFWADTFTDYVIEAIGAADGAADERLLALTRLIEDEGLNRYDIAFRSWAAQDEKVAKMVRDVDHARFRFVGSLFAEMGFTGADLNMRVHIWLVYASAHPSISTPTPDPDGSAALMRRHAFFLRPATADSDPS